MQMPSAAAGKDRFGVHRLRENPCLVRGCGGLHRIPGQHRNVSLWVTMAVTNKCLAQSNKSRTGGNATKKLKHGVFFLGRAGIQALGP